jgi:hypothetical protein
MESIVSKNFLVCCTLYSMYEYVKRLTALAVSKSEAEPVIVVSVIYRNVGSCKPGFYPDKLLLWMGSDAGQGAWGGGGGGGGVYLLWEQDDYQATGPLVI